LGQIVLPHNEVIVGICRNFKASRREVFVRRGHLLRIMHADEDSFAGGTDFYIDNHDNWHRILRRSSYDIIFCQPQERKADYVITKYTSYAHAMYCMGILVQKIYGTVPEDTGIKYREEIALGIDVYKNRISRDCDSNPELQSLSQVCKETQADELHRETFDFGRRRASDGLPLHVGVQRRDA
jgi:hypothetical protein